MTDHGVMGATFRGATGRLMVGCRLVAQFTGWEAESIPGPRRVRLTAKHSVKNPAYWGHYPVYKVELDLGRITLIGRARVEQETPLVLLVEEFTHG